ncbi:MAG TPA: hypothetical protein VND24_06475 [Steroidobacteraceae bacterium]|nr:hypothetical protein [Steroidobacteraceae bacterium]
MHQFLAATGNVEPDGWIYRDDGVRMEAKIYGLRTGIFGGSRNLIFNRFTGPGRVRIQTMHIHLPAAD